MRYVASCSFGKDSLAMLIKIKELGLPLDEVIYVDIRFDDEKYSGEMPKQREFIPKAEKILKERYNIDVTEVRGSTTFVKQFYTIKQKGNHIGDNYGFPYVIGAWCNARLKLKPIHNYLKKYADIHCAENVAGLYPVKRYAPNQFGLYDTYGNAYETYFALYDDGGYLAVNPCIISGFKNPGKACRELLRYKCLRRTKIVNNATFKTPGFQGLRMVRVLE